MTPEVCLEQYGEWAKRLIGSQTTRVYGIGPKSVGRDDCMQEGLIALMQALDRYEPQQGVPFKSYAQHVVKGRVVDVLRHRRLTPDPVVTSYGDLKEINNHHPRVVPDMESHCEASKIIDLFDRLNPRYRRIMRMYYLDGLQQQEIGEIEGITGRRVWQIHDVCIRKIRKMLGVKEMR